MEIKKTDEEGTFPINWFVRTYTGGLFSGGYMNQGWYTGGLSRGIHNNIWLKEPFNVSARLTGNVSFCHFSVYCSPEITEAQLPYKKLGMKMCVAKENKLDFHSNLVVFMNYYAVIWCISIQNNTIQCKGQHHTK